MVGGRRRRHATPRRTSKRNRHSHSVHTTGVSVRTLQVPFRNRPYGAYVQQACGSTGKAVKQTSGTCVETRNTQSQKTAKPSKRHRGAP